MCDQAQLKKARSGVLRLLTYRARTNSEVRAYLERKGYEPGIISAVMKEMQDYGYLNEAKYVEDMITYKQAQGFGMKRIRYDLQLKGAVRELVDAKMEQCYDKERDLRTINEILAGRIRRGGGPVDEKWVRRQVVFLQRRGFDNNQIFQAVKAYRSDQQSD